MAGRRRLLRIAQRCACIGPFGQRGDLLLGQGTLVLLPERAVTGRGLPGRHLAGLRVLLDGSGPGAGLRVGLQRERRDLAGPMAAFALGLQDRGYVMGIGRSALDRDHRRAGAWNNAAKCGRLRMRNRLAGQHRLQGIVEVVCGYPRGDDVIINAPGVRHDAARVYHDRLRGDLSAEFLSQGSLWITDYGEGEAVLARVLADGGQALLGIGVDGKDLHAPPGIVRREAVEAWGIGVRDRTLAGNEQKDAGLVRRDVLRAIGFAVRIAKGDRAEAARFAGYGLARGRAAADRGQAPGSQGNRNRYTHQTERAARAPDCTFFHVHGRTLTCHGSQPGSLVIITPDGVPALGFQVPRKKILDQRMGFLLVLRAQEAMPVFFHWHERRLHARPPQRVIEPLRLINGHQRIGGAVEDQERGRASAYVEDGRAVAIERGGLILGLAEEEGQYLDRLWVKYAGSGQREIRRAVEVYDALHPAAVAGQLRVGVIAGIAHAEEGDQVTARRVAERADAVRVEVILAGMGANPAHRPLHVI